LKTSSFLLEELFVADDKLSNLNDALRSIAPTRIPDIAIRKDYNLASEFHSRLVKWINDFDSSLDQEHEVGIRLVSFGQTVVFHLADIGYWNPSLISFEGRTDDGEPVELIQHVSQISILLMKLQRPDSSKPKRKIGFEASPIDAKQGDD
jgi:hypothetical protein